MPSMSPKEVSPGWLRLASSVAETCRLCGTVVTWLAGTVKVGPTCLTWQQTKSGFEGTLEAARAAVRTTTCIGPGLGIAGRVTLVIVPLPPVTGIGTMSVPTEGLLQLHMHDGEPWVLRNKGTNSLPVGAPSWQFRPGVIAWVGSPPNWVSAFAVGAAASRPRAARVTAMWRRTAASYHLRAHGHRVGRSCSLAVASGQRPQRQGDRAGQQRGDRGEEIG